MKNILLLSLLSALLLFSNCKGSKGTSGSKFKNQPGVQFVSSQSLTAVLEQAEHENKLVFVDFYTSWCLPCKMMDEEVFPDKAMGDYFKENFISYKVDAEKGNGINLATIYNTKTFPTLIFMDARGRTIERNEGSLSYTALMDMAERAASHRLHQ